MKTSDEASPQPTPGSEGPFPHHRETIAIAVVGTATAVTAALFVLLESASTIKVEANAPLRDLVKSADIMVRGFGILTLIFYVLCAFTSIQSIIGTLNGNSRDACTHYHAALILFQWLVVLVGAVAALVFIAHTAVDGAVFNFTPSPRESMP